MIALTITNIKIFMNQLLRTEIFDNFLLSEASITKGATFHINGRIQSSLYTETELLEQGFQGYETLPYARLRPLCYQLIRGRHTPVSFKFVLMLSPENLANTLTHSNSSFTPHDITGIFINLTYQNARLTLTTGVSYAIFSTDRTLDREWDAMVQKFLQKHAISFEEL